MMRFAMVIDAVVHEDDIRSALGLEPVPGGDAQALAITGNGVALSARVQRLGLPALVMSIEGEPHTFGEGAPGVTVNVTRYDAFRMLSGRYQPEKLAMLDWSGDPGLYLRVISEPYGPPLDAA